MGSTWTTSLAVFIGFLQIQALIGVKTTFVTGSEGQAFDFRCEYAAGQEIKAKYFYRVDDNKPNFEPIQTNKHNEWETKGRFSLFDNTTGSFFIVRVDRLYLNDSGTYWCDVSFSLGPDRFSVIQLNVDQAMETPDPASTRTMHKFTLQLFLTAVLCVAAILFVIMFTIFLLMLVKQRRSSPRKTRQTSSDYETMMPGVRTEAKPCGCCCSHPDCPGLSALPQPPDDLLSGFTPQHRDSTVSISLSDYADVDVREHVCQYQHLDLSQLDDHVYHSLYCSPKQTIH